MTLHFRIDHIVDAVRADSQIADRFTHDDATAFLTRELLNVRRQAILVERPELRGTFFVPASEQGDLGATHSTAQVEDFAGEAAMGSTMSTRPPRVDVSVQELTPIPYRHIEAAYGWSVKDIRSALMARRSLSAARALAAQQVIAIRHDDIIMIGDGTAAYLNCYGIFKLPNTVTYTPANGAASGLKTWETKNGKEMVADCLGLLNAIRSGSNRVEVPNMLALPVSSMTVLATTPWGVDSSETALDRLTRIAGKLYPGLMIEDSEKLETAGSGGTKRMAAYRRDSTKVYRDDLVLFEQAPPIINGWQTEVHCHGETAGVRAPKPKSIGYADGI